MYVYWTDWISLLIEYRTNYNSSKFKDTFYTLFVGYCKYDTSILFLFLLSLIFKKRNANRFIINYFLCNTNYVTMLFLDYF